MAKSFSSICFYCQSRFCCGIVFLFGKRDAGKNLVTVTNEAFNCGNEGSACCDKIWNRRVMKIIQQFLRLYCVVLMREAQSE